jgi:hypothetical protein
MNVTLAGSVSVSELSFKLTVVFDKMSTLPRDAGSFVESERFMTQHGTSLYVRMYIGGNQMVNTDHCSLYLNFTGSVKLSYSMKLVNHIDDKKSINRTDTSYDFKAGGDNGRGWKSVIKSEHLLDSVHGFLVQDAVTIVFQIKIEGNQRINDCRDGIINDVKALLYDESTTDYFITIVRDNNASISSSSTRSNRKRSLETFVIDTSSRITVHKVILQSRSKVFKAMLLSTMVESTSNEIIISDFDQDVVQEFINFLYLDTCDATVLDDHAQSLLAIAHKYEVNRLFRMCESFLINTLDVDNVVDFLKLGDLYGAMKLKGKALKLIKSEFKVLIKSGRFYESLNPDLLQEVICQLGDA